MTFAEKLQRALDKSGMTRSELADKAGISRPMITNYLNGGYKAKQNNIFKLARALNISENELIEDEYVSEHSSPTHAPAPDNTVQSNNIDSNDIINTLHQDGVMLDGCPLSPDEAERLRESIQLAIKQAKKTQGNKD